MLLYPLLQEYLIQNGNLPLPERGLFTVDCEPAYLQKNGNTMVAPTNDILFVPLETQESEIKNLVLFLSTKLNISFEQASELLKKENTADAIAKDMGDLIQSPVAEHGRSKNSKQTKTASTGLLNDYFPSFSIEKILRQPIAETLATPEIVTDSYTTYEDEEPVEKDYWWVWAIAIFVISILLILFR